MIMVRIRKDEGGPGKWGIVLWNVGEGIGKIDALNQDGVFQICSDPNFLGTIDAMLQSVGGEERHVLVETRSVNLDLVKRLEEERSIDGQKAVS